MSEQPQVKRVNVVVTDVKIPFLSVASIVVKFLIAVTIITLITFGIFYLAVTALNVVL